MLNRQTLRRSGKSAIHVFGALAAAFAIVGALVWYNGLDDPDAALQKKLIGVWKGSDNVAQYTITFYPTGDVTLTSGGTLLGNLMWAVSGELRGKWYVKHRRCYIDYKDAGFYHGKLGMAVVAMTGEQPTFVIDIVAIDAESMDTAVGIKYKRQR